MRPAFQRLVTVIALAAFCATMSARAVDTQHALGADPDTGVSLQSDGQLPAELLAQELTLPERGSFDEHCALCHWARTFSNTIAAEPVRDAVPDVVNDAVARIACALRSAALTAAPPRGPPALA